MQVKIRAASREAMGLAVGHLIEELKDHYKDFRNVLEFLDETMRDSLVLADRGSECRSLRGIFGGPLEHPVDAAERVRAVQQRFRRAAVGGQPGSRRRHHGRRLGAQGQLGDPAADIE